ncbi:MAG TPA: type I DNA topoisomerase [Isosphaeraceae bacterium]|jgi:DNA topoisomerase-1|nr:type I DNA topoisomerase [Isosphaeraceae bacterium]
MITTVARKSSTPKSASVAKTTKAAPKARSSAAKAAAGGGNGRASGKALVIVESPKKARSINKFLGPSYVVKASMGHVRDLPKKGRDLGIDIAKGYRPTYEVTAKRDVLAELRREADRAEIVYLATDPDREGEAIAWHLQQALGLDDDRVRRVQFFEITERAVREAFHHVGPIDMDKVNAQQARRFLDRFVGWLVSPLLWKKVARGLSAGRVQSVATRLIAEREKEIRAFVTEEYWKITATLSPEGATAEADRFDAELVEWKGSKFAAKVEGDARSIRDALASASYKVAEVEASEKADRPDAPFKTSTLQQQAAIRLRFAGNRTMKIAQELYEGIDVSGDGPVGLITYMRTDSLRVSEEAITAVRDLIGSSYGPKYLPDKPNRFAAGKQAQEAHEAIRPTDLSLTPERIKAKLSHDQYRLYQLVYRRFVASQMTPAIFAVTNVAIAAGEGVFKAQGKVMKFDGYRRVLAPAGKQEDRLLPHLAVGQALDLHELVPSQHFTQPPPRYTEATLIKALEKENIGRPSTYAEIIKTIQARNYVEQRERRFHATDLGLVVTDFLVEHFPKVLDVKFTAHMEDELDDIATKKEDMKKVLDEFYYPFREALVAAEANAQRVSVPTAETCHECGAPMLLKFGRTGEFLGCSRYPECKATRPKEGGPRPAAIETEHRCPKCGKTLLLRENARGPFLGCSGFPKCKETFNLDEQGNPIPTAVETEHACPKCGKPMALKRGPRGPFLGCTGYPKCRSTMPVDDQGKPVVPVTVDVKCEKCGSAMAVKQGRRGPFLGCTNYPRCRGTAPIPDEMKDKLGEMTATAAASNDRKAALKAIVVAETCDDCGGPMVVRPGRRGYFLGCAAYPKCKGTKEPGPVTLEKILAATGG